MEGVLLLLAESTNGGLFRISELLRRVLERLGSCMHQYRAGL